MKILWVLGHGPARGKILCGAVTGNAFQALRVPSRAHGCQGCDRITLAPQVCVSSVFRAVGGCAHRPQTPFAMGGSNRFVLPVRSCLMLVPKRLVNIDGARGGVIPLDSFVHACSRSIKCPLRHMGNARSVSYAACFS